ncbi:DUF5686 and carboxypeptidase-like regulatory domain-containing protein [Bacteroides intestinalis]|jgi:hypothetical protein|uniref:DUF5686 and carboxypeptidase-like regulatory domain-containing protein n=1 Tax=Bacteroides intestinalis TaxID=329854 RepID=UPI0022E8EB79|nr:DUF5686 and carboxypeptidase-like regulatory domain-containing protein [Bacteroides intestinalis]
MRFTFLRILLFINLCWMSFPLQAQYVVQGVVTDSLTREPLPYTSVYLKGTTEGGMTDDKGQFSFKTYRPQAVLVISAIGYNEYTRLIHPAQGIRLTIALSPATYALNEVVVKPKRERYKKKDNPAVEFVRQMIEHRDDYSPKELDFWQRDRYEKMTFAINNFDSVKQQKWLYRKFKFLTDYVDTSVVTGKPVLAVSNRELLATDYYRKSPKSQKQRVHARRQAGVDEMLSQQGMEQAISVTMTDVDIYENNITLFTNKFVSPLSSLGPSFYKYYLMDTLTIAGQPCVDLTFVPFNSESFGFTGHLYVTLDSTYFVRRAIMNFPQKINLNFVDYMSLEQNFTREADGTRQLVDEHITTEFKLVDNSDGIYAKRDVYYRNYVYEPSADALSAFKKPEKVIEPAEATHRTEAYWDDNRQVEVSKKETSVDKMMAQLRTYPVYYWTEKTLKVLFTGYIPAPKEKEPLFYIGMMNTTISGNTLEGVRLRAGGMTTAWLNPHLFYKGYMAYGFKDHRMKGMAEVEYSFHKKKEYANEFPIHSLKARYTSDVNQYGQHYLYTSQDNVFLSLKRQKDDRIGYQRKAELTYTNEFHSGFSFQLTSRFRQDESSYLIPFLKQDEMATPVKKISNAEFEVKLRYAPNEKFFQTQWNRFPVSLDAPVFSLSHTMAAKGVLGGDYTYQYTEAGFQKRFWFSAFGYTDVILKAGKVWNKVPFPLLIIPNANLSYTIQPESYSLMNAMEFMNDEYASWDVTYYLNGFLFNRVPLLKKLKWREVLSFRGLYGNLSDKNNPTVSNDLFCFPVTTSYMGDTPYMEVGIGVENILKVLRFDYVWRLTYRNLPGIDKSGLRISLHMTF